LNIAHDFLKVGVFQPQVSICGRTFHDRNFSYSRKFVLAIISLPLSATALQNWGGGYGTPILLSLQRSVGSRTTLENSGHMSDGRVVMCAMYLQDVHESEVKCNDSLRCQICTDADVDVAFVPCGHVMCCSDCSARLDVCPLCKAGVSQRLKIFLPCHSMPPTPL